MTKFNTTSFLIVIFVILLIGCTGGHQNESNHRGIPLVPIAYIQQMGGVINVRAPLHVEDTQLQLIEYDAAGERKMRLYREEVFPVDVMVAYLDTTESVAVYLRRSPHGGCLILWDSDENWFHDPCFGSKFDRNGRYISGPSPRNLDQLTASTRNGMVWIRAEVIYGELHP